MCFETGIDEKLFGVRHQFLSPSKFFLFGLSEVSKLSDVRI